MDTVEQPDHGAQNYQDSLSPHIAHAWHNTSVGGTHRPNMPNEVTDMQDAAPESDPQ